VDLKNVQASEKMADALVAFHNKYFGDNRKPEHWIWEYKVSYPDLSLFSVMMQNGDIAGTLGMIPIYLRVAGKRTLSAKCENALVTPEHRGSNLYLDLHAAQESNCRRKGFQFQWAYGPQYKSGLRCGFSVHKNAICSLGAVISPARVLADTLKSGKKGVRERMVEITSAMLLWLYGSARRATNARPKNRYVVRTEPLGQRDMDDLYQRLRSRFPDMIHIDLDRNYLKWRIYDHPFIQYKNYFVYRGSQLVAYSFVNAHKEARVYLTDFTYDDIDAGKFLLSRILKDLAAKKIGLLIFVGNRENPLIKETLNLLRKRGFVHIGATNFHIRNIQFKFDETISKLENWYMTGTASEGYEV